jgi:hypothetical protein
VTLAPLNVEELVTKVPVQHRGFRGAILLDNAAGLEGSVRVVKLELSHSVRIGAMKRAL